MTEAPALAITPLSPVACGASFCRLSGALWATVVVKATFQLVHGEPARLVTPLDLVTEDRPGGLNGSLERARETAPHVPNAGVLLGGHACAPEGRPVPSMSVRLGISRDRPLIDKTLHVFGVRSAAAPATIALFQKMPLVYERAFGGPGVSENPVGMGGAGSAGLPNVVDPKDVRRPVGFGPIARQWAPRRALLGGVSPSLLQSPVWDVPAGFDFRFFQAAPADQQLDRLRGDEWILLDGMSAAQARVQSRLPQVVAQARRHTLSGSSASGPQAIELRADMLVIDADRLLVSMIWRGRFAIESADALRASQVFVAIERPGESIVWPEPDARAAATVHRRAPSDSSETRDVDLKAMFGGAVPFGKEREGVLSPQAPALQRTPLDTGTGAVDLQKLFSQAVPFSEHGAAAPPAESFATPTAGRATPMSTGTGDVDLASILKSTMPYRGQATPAPAGPPPIVAAPSLVVAPVIAAPPVVAASPFIAPLPAIPPAAAPIVAAPPVIAPPAIAPPIIAPPIMRLAAAPAIAAPPLVGEAAPPPIAAAGPVLAAPSVAALARKRAEAKLADRQSFDGDDFSGANLSGLDFSGRSLVRCNLRGAKLRGAKLTNVKLSFANLDEADLRGAVLEDADLREASLIKADLERAKLARCNGEGAVFREANLLGADLRRARLANASFDEATLRDAQAEGAELTAARFHRADLTSACFRGARLRSAVLAFANLERADFQNADLEGANLHEAVRRMVKLAGANLSGVDESAPAAS